MPTTYCTLCGDKVRTATDAEQTLEAHAHCAATMLADMVVLGKFQMPKATEVMCPVCKTGHTVLHKQDESVPHYMLCEDCEPWA